MAEGGCMIRSPSLGETPRFADRVDQAKCLHCRAPFTKNAPNQKCCSERCRVERNRRMCREADRRKRGRAA